MTSESQTQNFIKPSDVSNSTLQFILEKWRNKPLHAAVFLENYEIVRILIVGGTDIEKQDENGNSALHIACIIGNYKMVRILTTQYGPPVTQRYLDQLNSGGQSCLHIAAYKNRRDIIYLLTKEGASIDVRETVSGGTPLHTAVIFLHKETVDYILRYCKPNLTLKNYTGQTANSLAQRIFNEMRENVYNHL